MSKVKVEPLITSKVYIHVFWNFAPKRKVSKYPISPKYLSLKMAPLFFFPYLLLPMMTLDLIHVFGWAVTVLTSVIFPTDEQKITSLNFSLDGWCFEHWYVTNPWFYFSMFSLWLLYGGIDVLAVNKGNFSVVIWYSGMIVSYRLSKN